MQPPMSSEKWEIKRNERKIKLVFPSPRTTQSGCFDYWNQSIWLGRVPGLVTAARTTKMDGWMDEKDGEPRWLNGLQCRSSMFFEL